MDILHSTAISRFARKRDSGFKVTAQCASLFDTALVGDPKSFSGGPTRCLVDPLVFTHAHFDRLRFRQRNPALSNSKSDSITLQFYRPESIQEILNETSTASDLRTGETVEQYGVVIPRDRIVQHDRIQPVHPMFSWDADSPQGGLLINSIATIWRQLPRATQAGASALALAFVGLLNGLLAAEPDPIKGKEIERIDAATIQNYLRANLQHGDIDVDKLCRQFYCSRATLYRMFREHGGVKTYLRDLRLEHCLRELAQVPDNSCGRIRKVAEHWGFFDPSHFSRVFKRRFGIMPSDVPASSHASEPVPAGISHQPPAITNNPPASSGQAWLLNIRSTLSAPDPLDARKLTVLTTSSAN